MSPTPGRTYDAAVVGAGIVGIAIALELQAAGFGVALVDPNEPGLGTAAGSAGYLADSEIFPLANAALLFELPKMLFDPLGPLVIRPAYAPRLFGWSLRFLAAMRPSRFQSTVRALATLNEDALDLLFGLASRSGAADYLVRDGAIVACRSSMTVDKLVRYVPLLAENGIALELLDRVGLRALEPALSGDLAGGVYYPREGRCTDPAAFGWRLAAHAIGSGSAVVRARATMLESQPNGGWRIWLDGATQGMPPKVASLDAKLVVVSAGVWSGCLMRELGYRVPIETQRGYHLMLPSPGVNPKRVILFGEPHFCATPMRGGLRLAGTVEFAGLDAPANFRRSDMLFDLASGYLPGLRRDGATRWMGFRPSFPDSLPAIGAAPNHRNLFYCFGHEKLGLTQAAISARCIAELVANRAPSIDLTPFRIERFKRFFA